MGEQLELCLASNSAGEIAMRFCRYFVVMHFMLSQVQFVMRCMCRMCKRRRRRSRWIPNYSFRVVYWHHHGHSRGMGAPGGLVLVHSLLLLFNCDWMSRCQRQRSQFNWLYKQFGRNEHGNSNNNNKKQINKCMQVECIYLVCPWLAGLWRGSERERLMGFRWWCSGIFSQAPRSTTMHGTQVN